MIFSGKQIISKVVVLICVIAIVVVAVIWVSKDRILHAAINKVILKQLKTDDQLLKDDGLHVIVVGSGNNKYPPGRTQPCYAVIAGGQLFVFDAGLSAARGLSQMKLPLEKLRAVFITHYHSDHMSGLGALIESGWLFGDQVRSHSLEVYGPEGIETVVDGFNRAYLPNTTIRSSVHGLPVAGAMGLAKEIALNGNEPVKVYDENGLIVFAFLVDHQNPLADHDYAMNAVGYRIEYKGRVAVLSGDTRAMPKMADYAKEADLLVHDAFDLDIANQAKHLMEEIGQPKLARLIEKANAHHTNTIDAARIAQKAGVKKLVLTHVRHGQSRLGDWLFMRGVKEAFSGETAIAEDGMDIYLPPKS